MQPNKLFTIIFGPTASGKTNAAYHLAGEEANILSFDSRHVYKEMSIVTGKDLSADAHPVGFIFPNEKTYCVYAHAHITDRNRFSEPLNLRHLTDYETGVPSMSQPFLFGIDIVSIKEDFSIRHFYEYARPILEAHRQQNKPLILVGGSWQYASVLLDPPASLFAEKQITHRSELEALPVSRLQEMVQQRNPQRWETLNFSDRANPRRLLRALEVGEMPPVLPQPLIGPDEYEIIVRNPPIEELEQKIGSRIDARLKQGALEETQQLMNQFGDWSLPAFSSTGYKILRKHLEHEISLEEAKQLWFLQERQYVKRQKTWIKKLQYNSALI